jgi:tetratricopeptide (TPR) repeat protein
MITTPRPIQDWVVPVVYEEDPQPLFQTPEREHITITLSQSEGTPDRAMLDPTLPADPDVGFYGRDETLLALDRAFDTNSIVLLHGVAGSGKTATAAEFARWYALTGGVEGPVLFSSFERFISLNRVLDRLGEMFSETLRLAGIQWLALTDANRRAVGLQVLQQIPVLWLWDGVEPVGGFPTAAMSSWSPQEQDELVEFLRAAQRTKARFLLTSRRDEQAWLGDLPTRVAMPVMPMRERVDLVRAITSKQGRRSAETDDWTPLLKYGEGNPLNITVLVGQALREGLSSRTEIENFVAQLQTGEAHGVEVDQGRTKALGASLSYALTHNFSENERRQLSLLHLFQGFVAADVLCVMGNSSLLDPIQEISGLTRGVAVDLLDRAAQVGLLTSLGGGSFAIHPALPWYFESLFTRYYGSPDISGGRGWQAARAFAEAMGMVGTYYSERYEAGRREVIDALASEEGNLLQAQRFCRSNGLWPSLIGTMQALRVLYGHMSRSSEWARLVEEVVPLFVDLTTDAPLPEREEFWPTLTSYRVQLAAAARDWANAERLQRLLIAWYRNLAGTDLDAEESALTPESRGRIRSLATSVEVLGHLIADQERAECVEAYEESLDLFQRIGYRRGVASIAYSLGQAHLTISGTRDLAAAEAWLKRSLTLIDEDDLVTRAQVMRQLGSVAYERFQKEKRAGVASEHLLAERGETTKALLSYLDEAEAYYNRALNSLPVEATGDRALLHSQLGTVYTQEGKVESALQHYVRAVRLWEILGDRYGAGQARANASIALAQAGRGKDALLYAQAALRDFEQYGSGASNDIAWTRDLLASIEELTKSEA